MGVEVLFEGRGVVVVDKPAGLATTGRDLQDEACMQYALTATLGRPTWAVHQLDKDTSGIVLFVTRKNLVVDWQRRLRGPSSKKDYLAFVHGDPTWTKRLLEDPLRWDSGAHRQRVDPVGKACRTLVRVAARAAAGAHGEEGRALVEARLLTGRTHQIRAHLSAAGHPLLGERRYRDPPSEAHARCALHARRLRFVDDGQERVIEAPLPADLQALAARLDLSVLS